MTPWLRRKTRKPIERRPRVGDIAEAPVEVHGQRRGVIQAIWPGTALVGASDGTWGMTVRLNRLVWNGREWAFK